MDNKKQNKSTEIAGRTFDTSDYEKNDTLSSGLATTHEQVSDAYTEGEAGGEMKNAGKGTPLKQEESKENK